MALDRALNSQSSVRRKRTNLALMCERLEDRVTPQAYNTVSFQQGVAPYTGAPAYNGAIDTYLDQINASTPFGSASVLEARTADRQPLLQFGNIFSGLPASSADLKASIPSDARIVSASLTVNITEAGDGAALYRMNKGWAASDTWNTLVNGITTSGAGADTVPFFLSQIGFPGETGLSGAGLQSIDVTNDVRAFQSTGTNNGWAFLSWNSSSNSFSFSSSEATAALRPRLTVTYTFPEARTATFQQGVVGVSSTTVDTEIQQAAPSTAFDNQTIRVRANTGSNDEIQGLVRFNNIIGTVGAQIPADAWIFGAYLSLTTTSIGGGSGGSIAQMRGVSATTWDETSTWSTFGTGVAGGVQVGTEANSTSDTVGRNSNFANVENNQIVTLDVTASVQAFAEGTLNNGWVILPTGVNGKNDWEFFSSEAANPNFRPTLVVQYAQRPILLGVNNMTAIDEDQTDPASTLISSLIAGQITDDSSSKGVAITNLDTTIGRWQFTLDGGTNWSDINLGGKLLLLAADSDNAIRLIPNANYFGTTKFKVRAWDQFDRNADGSYVSLDQNVLPALSRDIFETTLVTNPIPDTPLWEIKGSSLFEDTKSDQFLFITRNPVDGPEVGYFKFSNIANGDYYLWDDTLVVAGTAYDIDDVSKGMYFDPDPDFWGDNNFGLPNDIFGNPLKLSVVATLETDQNIVSPDPAEIGFGVLPVPDDPQIVGAPFVCDEDTNVGGIVILNNSVDNTGGKQEVNYFRISAIIGGRVFLSDGKTEVKTGAYVLLANVGTGMGMVFVPNANFYGVGGYSVQASTGNDDNSQRSGLVQINVTVNPLPDLPTAVNAVTDEDVMTKVGVIINRNPVDGIEVTHFWINNIQNGKLYLADGKTQVTDNQFVTVLQGQKGLRFLPNANFSGVGSFDVKAALGATIAQTGTDVLNAIITVNPAAEPPIVTGTSTLEDSQTKTGVIIKADPIDGTTVTHFQITGIADGTLFLADGTTKVSEGQLITAAQGLQGLKFTPAPDFNGKAFFNVQASFGSNVSQVNGDIVRGEIDVQPVADTPRVTDTRTGVNQTTTGTIVITRAAVDGDEITHFRISGITNGTVFLADGITAVNSGDFISAAQATQGLKFTPTTDFFGIGGFLVQASLNNTIAGIGGASVKANIAVGPTLNTPVVTSAVTDENESVGSLFVRANTADGAFTSYFQITNIEGGKLYLADGKTAVIEGSFITVAQGAAGLQFVPFPDFNGQGSFQAQSSLGNVDIGRSGGLATAIITINSKASTPTVTNSKTREEFQTISGLVITKNPLDGSDTTHYQISNISGGTVYLADGTTVVPNGGFITIAQGKAGLKFTPTDQFFGIASFDVRASQGSQVSGLGGEIVAANIVVDPSPDTPTVNNATVRVNQATGNILNITPNPVDRGSIQFYRITGITNGSLFRSDGVRVNNGDFLPVAFATGLEFVPTTDFVGIGWFDILAGVSNQTNGLGGGFARSQITVLADTPVVPPIVPPVVPPTPPIIPGPGAPIPGRFATGADAGGGPMVRVFDSTTGAEVGSFFAYDPFFAGGVRVAMGDVNGDGVADIVTVPGQGGTTHVKVFDGATFEIIANFFAYEESFTGGGYVAVADADGDGISEIFTGTGNGGGPRIRVLKLDGTVVADFFAYEPSFRGGVITSAGDLNGDGRAEIIAGAGIGGGPRVVVFDGVDYRGLVDFFAYDTEFRGGVNVTSRDITGDGLAEIITGPGTSTNAELRIFGPRGQLLRGFAVDTQNVPVDGDGGLRVATTNTAEGSVQIVTSLGSGQNSVVTVFTAATLEEVRELEAFPNFFGGVWVGGS